MYSVSQIEYTQSVSQKGTQSVMKVNPSEIEVEIVDHYIDDKQFEFFNTWNLIHFTWIIYEESMKNDNVLGLLFDQVDLIDFCDNELQDFDYREDSGWSHLLNYDNINQFRQFISDDNNFNLWCKLMYSWIHHKLTGQDEE